MGAINVSGKDFESEVLKSKIPVLVDFWAEWCGPCKAMAPVLEEIAGEMDGKLKIVKVDIDDNQELAEKFNVMSIPTMLVFKGGESVQQIVGAMGKDQLMEKIQTSL